MIKENKILTKKDKETIQKYVSGIKQLRPLIKIIYFKCIEKKSR